MIDTYDQIKKAILGKLQVIAMYQGKYREMCPHVIGIKNGHEKALFYQFAGQSKSGFNSDPASRWRDTFVKDIRIIELREGEWHSGPKHSRPQRAVDEIDAEVDY